MTAGKCEITRCGLCRFYSHEGRRGGLCSQLNVNVDAQWTACCLASSPFAPDKEEKAGITAWSASLPLQEPVLPVLNQSDSPAFSTVVA